MIIYDKNLERTLDIPKRQAEIMLRYKPHRYVKASEVRDVSDSKPTKPADEPVDATKGAIEAAEELGIDLSDLSVEGRITKSDVINFNK